VQSLTSHDDTFGRHINLAPSPTAAATGSTTITILQLARARYGFRGFRVFRIYFLFLRHPAAAAASLLRPCDLCTLWLCEAVRPVDARRQKRVWSKQGRWKCSEPLSGRGQTLLQPLRSPSNRAHTERALAKRPMRQTAVTSCPSLCPKSNAGAVSGSGDQVPCIRRHHQR
jgi:hypothetical protein